jgi:hypothetical protein
MIPVKRMVNTKITIGKIEGRGGGQAQGVTDPHPKNETQYTCIM